MSLIEILLIVWIIVFIGGIVVDLLRFRQAKKQAVRNDYIHSELLEAHDKLSYSVRNLGANMLGIDSVKRSIRVLLEELDRLEEKFDKYFKPQKVEPFPVDREFEVVEDDDNGTT